MLVKRNNNMKIGITIKILKREFIRCYLKDFIFSSLKTITFFIANIKDLI